MQNLTILVIAAMAVVVVADEFYTGKWNHVDTHAIIDNDRAFKKYKTCIVNKENAGCPQEALELRKVLPEALKTVCSKCSPEQVEKIKDTLGYICSKRRGDFDEVLSKFDPEGTYRPAFEEKYGKLPNC